MAASEQHEDVERMPFPVEQLQDGIRKEVELLRRCDEMVSKLGLFLPNETKEDVSTTKLSKLWGWNLGSKQGLGPMLSR